MVTMRQQVEQQHSRQLEHQPPRRDHVTFPQHCLNCDQKPTSLTTTGSSGKFKIDLNQLIAH